MFTMKNGIKKAQKKEFFGGWIDGF